MYSFRTRMKATIFLVFCLVNLAKGCDETIEAESGTFTSPNYPNNYRNNQQCTYSIIVPEGRTILLTFTAFDTEDNFEYDGCYDYVTIDGGAEICGTNLPSPVRSESNLMTVIFISDYTSVYQGFSASFTSQAASHDIGAPTSSLDSNNLLTATDSWETNDLWTATDSLGLINQDEPTSTVPSVDIPSCDDTIEAESGTFTSPNYPNNYRNNQQCTYSIIVPEGKTILLTFTAFDIEASSGYGCYDYVIIDSGAQRCGTNVPTPIRSESNLMTVIFQSDESSVHQGFSASFTSQTASHDIRTPTSSLESNDLLTATDSWETNDLWTTTDSLGLINQDGPTSAAPSIDIPSCDDTIEAESGTFTSPNYPNNYRNNQQCTYSIIVPEGKTILLTFTAFDIEASSGYGCYDYVIIDSGAQRCGTNVPTPVRSESNLMTVIFQSDESSVHQGFSASFTSQTASHDIRTPTSSLESNDLLTATDSWETNDLWTATDSLGLINQDGPTSAAPSIDISSCDDTIEAESGTFTSPNYPNNYRNNQQCTYSIIVPEGKTILLTFTAFDTEVNNFEYQGCFDYVTIDGGTQMCGTNVPTPVRSESNLMTVVFQSDGSTVHRGFSASFTSQAGCDDTIEAESGTFTSPNYPNNYRNYQQCTYSIIVPEGKTILLTFTAFDTEVNNFEYQGCFDYVTIDGGTQMCGTNVPTPVRSESNLMTVVFQSDGSTVHRGFSASFTSQAASHDIGAPTSSLESNNLLTATDSWETNDLWTATDSLGLINQDGPTSAGLSVDTPTPEAPNDLPTSIGVPTNQDGPNDPGTTVSIPTEAPNDLQTSTGVPTNQGGPNDPGTTDAVMTTTESVEDGSSLGVSSDAVSILLVTIGVVAGLCVTSVVAGFFYLKFTKNNVVDLQKKTKRSKTRKKRKEPEVRELSKYPAFTPPRSVLYPIPKVPLEKASELTMVDA